MNTNQINNRKAALIQSIKNGLPLDYSVAPGEFLALVAHTDPVNFSRGFDMLLQQTKADESEFFGYQFENECYEDKLEMVRNTLYMDPVRAQINRFKYENGLIPDDEILAFVLFLIADSDLVAYATETGEVEFDDLANLINHMANRAKFLLMCLRDNRYDILNLVVQYARKEKSDQIDTLFCFDTVEPDDGGVIGYYRTLTDKDAYYEKYGDGCIPAFAGKERMRDLGLSDDEDDFDEDNDYEDEVEDELDEPLVERDFEG